MLIKNEKMCANCIRAFSNKEHYNIVSVISIESTCNVYVVKCTDGFKYFFDKKVFTIEYGKGVVII